MSAVQKQVYTTVAAGIPGMKANVDSAIYTALNYVAGEGGVKAGAFAFASSDKPGVAVQTGGTLANLIGFVERVMTPPLYEAKAEGSLVIPEGQPLTIALFGSFYAVAPGEVKAYETPVKISGSTGELDESGDITLSAMRYATSGSKGDVVIIQSY